MAGIVLATQSSQGPSMNAGRWLFAHRCRQKIVFHRPLFVTSEQ